MKKVNITVEVGVEEMLQASNETLRKMFDNQIFDNQIKEYHLKSVILATITQNEHLLEMMKTEPYKDVSLSIMIPVIRKPRK
jgi:type IV secretory pathway TrbF-like protein